MNGRLKGTVCSSIIREYEGSLLPCFDGLFLTTRERRSKARDGIFDSSSLPNHAGNEGETISTTIMIHGLPSFIGKLHAK